MEVHLHKDVFEITKKGFKNVEARVNDEKRRKLKIGDELIFINRGNENETIKATIINLNCFNTFEEMSECYDMKILYLENYTKDMWLNELKRFYSDEEIKKYGVVAIEFKMV